jgi:hypothetical protein
MAFLRLRAKPGNSREVARIATHSTATLSSAVRSVCERVGGELHTVGLQEATGTCLPMSPRSDRNVLLYVTKKRQKRASLCHQLQESRGIPEFHGIELVAKSTYYNFACGSIWV